MDGDECQEHVKSVLSEGAPKALHDAIVRKLGKLDVSCVDCSKLDGIASSFARAYFSAPHLEDTRSQEQPAITMCFNRLRDAEEVREALTHELVHAYDHCVARRDLTTSKELACSEVRAAREAECRSNFGGGPREICKLLGVNPFVNQRTRGDSSRAEMIADVCEWFKRRCAMRFAVKSVDAVFPNEGERAVREVIGECFADAHPFCGDSTKSQVKSEVPSHPGVTAFCPSEDQQPRAT